MRNFIAMFVIVSAVCTSAISCEHDSTDCEGVGGGGSGGASSQDAGRYHDWCSSVACVGGDCNPLSCETCATAPPGEPWCGDDSPCKALGMEAMGCSWNSIAEASCVETGAYLCGEQGRIVCCPKDPQPLPQCGDMGAASCPVIGECMEAYCAICGCAYGQMGQGNPCGDATKTCSNGVCQ